MTTPEDFEQRLTDRMERAGESLTGEGVTLDGVRTRHRERARTRRLRRGAVVAVAAAVLAVVGVGLALGVGDDGTTRIAANDGSDSGSPEVTGAPTTVPCESPDVFIFLEPAITDAGREAVAAALESDPRVESFRYVSQREAYEEARELFADQPVTRDMIEEEDVPPSFRVRIGPVDGGVVAELRESFNALAGVREVTVHGVVPTVEMIAALKDASMRIEEGEGDRLTEEQVEALVAYLRGLVPAAGGVLTEEEKALLHSYAGEIGVHCPGPEATPTTTGPSS